MDKILESIAEWLKEVLVGGIVSNLSGMFDSVNQQVGDIAGQVGATPQAWNGTIYSMIRSLSDNVIVPIAGVILAFVMTMELIQMVSDKNNMHGDVDTWMFFKWIFKTACAVLIVTNTWNIVMGVFDVGQSVVNSAAGVISADASIDISTVAAVYAFGYVREKRTASRKDCLEHRTGMLPSPETEAVSDQQLLCGVRATRLQFSDEERASPELKKAIQKADKKADKLDKAEAKIPKKTVKRKERVVDAEGRVTTRLYFEEADKKKPPSKLTHAATAAPINFALATAHREVRQSEDENVGTESAHKVEEVAEDGVRMVDSAYRSHKLKPYREAAHAEAAADKANLHALNKQAKKQNPEFSSNREL